MRLEDKLNIRSQHNSKPRRTVKCTLVQALRLCTGRTANRASRGIALPFFDYGTRRGWGVSFTPRPLFTPGKDPVTIVQEAGWASGPVWTGAENLASTGFWSSDRPALSQSLYGLSYRGPQGNSCICATWVCFKFNWNNLVYICEGRGRFRYALLSLKKCCEC